MAEKKIPYGEGWILPDKKQYWFMKRSAADIDISDDKGGDFFTYTPGFGEFKDVDLFEYLENYVKVNELKWCDVNIEWCRHCHYEIDPETKELGEFLESSGIEGEYLEWNPKTQEFDEMSFEEEEEDEEEEE